MRQDPDRFYLKYLNLLSAFLAFVSLCSFQRLCVQSIVRIADSILRIVVITAAAEAAKARKIYILALPFFNALSASQAPLAVQVNNLRRFRNIGKMQASIL